MTDAVADGVLAGLTVVVGLSAFVSLLLVCAYGMVHH